jgi:hypothetical protein
MHDTTQVPKNLEQTLQNLEESFWYILNNPSCYSEILYRFFDKNSLFCMFPHCEAFFRVYRLTGKTSTLQFNANIIREGTPIRTVEGGGTTILDEI